jgi:hypothetical protein
MWMRGGGLPKCDIGLGRHPFGGLGGGTRIKLSADAVILDGGIKFDEPEPVPVDRRRVSPAA